MRLPFSVVALAPSRFEFGLYGLPSGDAQDDDGASDVSRPGHLHSRPDDPPTRRAQPATQADVFGAQPLPPRPSGLALLVVAT
jgi:hypothetical protein